MRWTAERTNSCLSNYGQLRTNTDRQPRHRLAHHALAIALQLTTRLIDWRNPRQPWQSTCPLTLSDDEGNRFSRPVPARRDYPREEMVDVTAQEPIEAS